MEKKRREIEKGKEVEKLQNEESEERTFFFFFFFFLPFHLSKPLKFVLGLYQSGNFLPGKSISPWEKNQEK